jgi:hypothetical protein
MNKHSNSVLVGVFFKKVQAEKAFQSALDLGYAQNEINVIMTESTMKEIYGEDLKKLAPSSTSSKMVQGGTLGGVTGGIIGLLAAIGITMFVPVFGLIIAGPLAGMVTGTLMGTLIALEVSEIQAQNYEEQLTKGAIILSLRERFESDLAKTWKELEES